MTLELEIEQALLRMDQEAFARLVPFLLERKGYPRFNVNTVSGSLRSRKGVPDAFCAWPDGSYSFLACTVQKNGLEVKLMNDLGDCIHRRPSNMPQDRIKEVILATSERIPLELARRLEDEAMAIGVALELFDPDRLVPLLRESPDLAEYHLGIQVTSGQIMDRAGFLLHAAGARHATNYATTFRFRDAEVEEALAQLRVSSVVVLSGHGGVGKTRTALEIIDRAVATDPEQRTLYVRSRDLPTAEELFKRCAALGNYLILLDDAHQFGDLERILDVVRYAREDRKVKVVCTVRRIAERHILDITEGLRSSVAIRLEPLTDQDVTTFLDKEYGIRDSVYVDRILGMAEGNPRMAAMVGSIIHKAKGYQGFSNVAQAFRLYYGQSSEAQQALADPIRLKVLWAFAFFRTIEGRYDVPVLPLLLPLLGMDKETFWGKAKELDELELIDLGAPQGPGSIADETFGTFVNHRVLFDLRMVSLKNVLVTFFPTCRDKIIRALNGVTTIFHQDGEVEELKGAVDSAIAHFAKGEEKLMHELHVVFWQLHPTRTLALAQSLMEAMPSERPVEVYVFAEERHGSGSLDMSMKLVHSCAESGDASIRGIVLDLALEHLRRFPSKASMISRAMRSAFDLNDESASQGYVVQQHVTDKLIGLSKEGDAAATALFLQLAGNFLTTEGWRIVPSRKPNVVTSRTHQPRLIPTLATLRTAVWNHVFHLYGNHRELALAVVKEHLASRLWTARKEILSFDAAFIADFLQDRLDPSDPAHCAIVHDFLMFWGRRGLESKKTLAERFVEPAFRLMKRLEYDRALDDLDGMDGLDAWKIWQKQMHALGEGTAPMELFRWTVLSRRVVGMSNSGFLGMASGLSMVIVGASTDQTGMAQEVVRREFRRGNPLGLGPFHLLPALVDECGGQRVRDLLLHSAFPNRSFWLSSFYREMVHRNEHDGYGKELEEHLISEWKDGHGMDLELAAHYEPVHPGLLVRLLGMAMEQENDSRLGNWLFSLFDRKDRDLVGLLRVFEDSLPLLQRAFFHFQTRHHGGDAKATASFMALLNADASFLERWVGWRYEGSFGSPEPERYELSAIWSRPDAEKLMDKVFRIASSRPRIICGNDDYMSTFFNVPEDHEGTEVLRARQDAWLRGKLARHARGPAKAEVLLGIIHTLPMLRRLELIELFMDQGPSERVFRQTVLDHGVSRITIAKPGGGDRSQVDYLELLRGRCARASWINYRLLLEDHLSCLKRQMEKAELHNLLEG